MITRRAVALGLAAGAALCAVTPYNDNKIGATNLAGNQFPVGAIFVLFLLSVPINALLRRFATRAVFTRPELLTVWTLILVASGLPSSGLMRFLLPHLAAPQYFSNGTNNWEARVWGGLPSAFRLTDKAAAEAYYSGYPRGAEHIPWEAWWRPLLAWGAFGLCFFLVTFCLASLLRHQWIENEKFVFPLVSLPLLLTESPPSFLHSRPLWLDALVLRLLGLAGESRDPAPRWAGSLPRRASVLPGADPRRCPQRCCLDRAGGTHRCRLRHPTAMMSSRLPGV